MKTTDSKSTTFAGFLIVIPLGGAILYWYNHVLFHPQQSFWLWLCMAVVVIWMQKAFKWLQNITGIVFFVCLVCQILSWFSVITLPIFK